MTPRERIERYLSTPPGGMFEGVEGADFYTDVMLMSASSYGGEIDEDFCLHMEALLRDAAYAATGQPFDPDREPEWRKLRTERGWPEGYQTLWNMVLAHAGMVDWGTSIRGVWFEYDLVDIMPALIARFRAEP